MIIGAAVIVLVVAVILARPVVFGQVQPGSAKTTLQPVKTTATINREFLFPLKDDKGEEVSKVKYSIENAELRNEIIVKGKRTTTISGRIFLILNLKLGNETNRLIKINTRDYIRVSVNGQEWLAPDIHNDPVEIQPISTKYTRVGLPINDTERNFKVRVGEISGEKTTIDIKI